MDYDIDDEVTIGGRWYIIEDVEREADGVFFLLCDQDGNNRWATENELD